MKMYSLTQKYVLCKITVFLILPGSLIASVSSNLEVIDSLFVDYFTEKVVNCFSDEDSAAIICNLTDKVIQSYVFQIVGNLLFEKSIVVFRNYNSKFAFEGVIIEIKNVIPRVDYSAPYNKSPVAVAHVRRMISVQIAGQIYKAQNGRVIDSLDEILLFDDEVPAHKLEDIDNSPYEFTIGKRVFSSKWDTYFEPLLLVSTIGIIIYLFFSQRF